MKKILYILILLPLIGYAQNKPISAMDTILVFSDSMFIPIVDPSEASPSNRNKRFFIRQLSLKYQERSSNLVGLSAMTDVGNMKRNGLGDYSADTVLLKADTVRADAELYVRDSTLLQIIQANAQTVNILNNANNRVTTSTGNANELQAEANLTFDGSTLTMAGTGNVTGQWNVDNLRLDGNLISSETGHLDFETKGANQNIMFTLGNTTTSIPKIYFKNAQSGNDNIEFRITDRSEAAYGSLSIHATGYSFIGATNTTLLGIASTGQAQINATTNQLRLGTTNTTTITSPAPSSSRTYTIPDAGANTNFIMGAGENTITNSGSTVPLTITKSGSANGLVINQTGSGSGLVVTNSGGGVALQAGNISVDGNTIGSSDTNGNIVIQPNGVGGVFIGSSGNNRVLNLFSATGVSQVLSLINASGLERFRFLYDNTNPTFTIASDATGAVSWDFVRSSGSFRINNGNLLVQTGSVGTTGTRITSSFFTNITSTNAVVVDSDSTLKQNIKPITNATEKVLAINPVEYTWKTDTTSKVHYGVIAQEINEVLPNIVISNGETLGVAYGELIPYLIAAIKELEARVKELEGN